MMNNEENNIMGTLPIPKVLLKMGIPMVVSMMIQALYNIVDSAFISNMAGDGENALNALTLAFPVQMLMVAIGIGTGVGAGALLSLNLGMGNRSKVNKVVGNTNFLCAIIYLVYLLFGLFGVGAYISSQTDNPVIGQMAVDYLRICCCMSMGIVFFSGYEKMLQATGRSIYSTVAQVAGALTNIVLDPILIYGLLGVPRMGVKGAAYATVIGQIVSLVLAFIFHLKKNVEIENSISYMKPSASVIREIYSIGLPAIIAQALMSVMTYALNIILGKIGENTVTAYGLFYKIQQFILFAAFGMRDAITPVISYNYGRGEKSRVFAGMKWGLIYSCGIMFLGMVILEVFASPISAVFGLSGATNELCITAMRIISLSFVFAGANVAFQGIYQALDSGMESLLISLFRQFLFVVPVAYVLAIPAMADPSKTWLVWLTFPFAELVSMLIGIGLLKRVIKKL